MTTFYVPVDAAARSVGADEVAAALAVLHGACVVRTGSRGMLWCEPLVEVDTDAGRVGYGPVTPTAARELADLAGAEPPPTSPLRTAYLGLVEQHPFLARQRRLTTARLGVIDPGDLADYERHGGGAGFRRPFPMPPEGVVAEVPAPGLRGRGGAGFPAGVKWATVAGAPGTEKCICANGDEGDSGTFADRMLIEGDPGSLLEGMLIAGYAVGAHTGVVYLRSEYPDAITTLRRAVESARAAGILGPNVLGSGFAFDVDVRVGAGAYICGEETSMLESIEGRRGEVRSKPPIPALRGLFGRPTVVNNILTLATVPAILADGGSTYAAYGTDRSRGTQVFQLAGNIARGGLVEVDFGVTVRELVEGFGGGTRSGRPVRAVQLGGPLGAYLPESALDLPMDYEALAAAGFMLGHGGIVVFDDTVDMARQARFAMEFCVKESCGKCTPCRVGSQRGMESLDRFLAGADPARELPLLDRICTTMAKGSLCAMGQLTPMPVRSALTHFPEDFAGGRR